MNKIRVCHMADFHLGGKLGPDNGYNEQINNNILKSLQNVIKVLNSAKVDIILLAGDFYETSSVDFSLLNNVKEIIGEFRGHIVLSPGNHDYVSIESVYHGEWPSNFNIFKDEEIAYFEFEDIKTRVYGFGFNHSHIFDRKLSKIKYQNIDENYINLGVFHGQVDSQLNSYHPIFLEDIENSRLDYVALGHVHKRTEIMKIGKSYYSYCGNPVGRGFDELGEKGIYLGDISKNYNKLNFYKLSENEFHILNIEMDDFSSQQLISQNIREHLEEKFGSNFKKNFYRIKLNGRKNKDENINAEIIKGNLVDINYIEIIDETKVMIDIENIKNEKSLKGIFVRNILSSDMNEDVKDEIIDLGFKAFEDLI